MKFTPESLASDAGSIFRDRVVAVLCNSPLHEEEVAVVELYTPHQSWEGAIKLSELILFAGIIGVSTRDVYLREQSAHMLELWLFAEKDNWLRVKTDFDEDPTPVQ